MLKQLLGLSLVALMLASCGVDSKHFKLEGRLLNLNQGEFYVYSNEGTIDGIDTIKVQGGRFAMEMPCDKASTLMLVFPNFSEQPIFIEPGGAVEIKGDASHLKELKVNGTKTNELMNKFREQIASASPPEIKKLAKQFVEDHLDSPVSVYLVKKYFVTAQEPDYKEAKRLIEAMLKEQEGNVVLARMKHEIQMFGNLSVGSKLPAFTAHDINGRLVSSSDYATGVAVIYAWASWNYESTTLQRQLKNLRRKYNEKLKLVSISVDASSHDCRNYIKNDSVTWPLVCDGMMFDSKPMKLLGLNNIPDNILTKNGRVIARGLSTQDLLKKIEEII